MKPLVLFVDDEESVIDAIRVLLEPMRSDWDVMYATNSGEALETVRRMAGCGAAGAGYAQEFAVVVSDLCMPGVTGVDLFEALHAQSPDTVRILLTANTDLHAAIRSINDGRVHRYLTKSAIIDNLVLEVAQAVAQYRTRKTRREELDAARRARELFLGAMTHEVRTPLNGVMGMLQLLMQTPLDAEQREYARDAMASSARLARLLDDVLDYARLASGRGGEREAVFDPGRMMREVEASFADRARDKGLEFTCRAGADVPRWLRGREGLLRQILFHLTDNALKCTDQGFVRVTAGLLPHAREGEACLLFTVADSGPGIPEGRLEAVFRPFVQVEESYSRSREGAGLGLAIVHRLVRLLDASCLAVDSGREGTVFYLSAHLRLTRPGPDGHPGRAVRAPRILAAAASPQAVTGLARALSGLGFDLEVVPDGNAALRRLAGGDYRLLIVEMGLPDMDGREVARIVRSSPGFGDKSRLPILGIGGTARSRGTGAAIDAWLALPLDKARILAVVTSLVGQPVWD